MTELFNRDCEWFEVWRHWGSHPLHLAIVCKFRNDDAILLYSLFDKEVWMISDYESIQTELLEDDYEQIRGRVSDDELK